MALTSAQHKEMAEELLREAVTVHDKISNLADERAEYQGWLDNLDSSSGNAEPKATYFDLIAELTQQMDEYGKKIMGIFAQAQVHATLATVPDGPIKAEPVVVPT